MVVCSVEFPLQQAKREAFSLASYWIWRRFSWLRVFFASDRSHVTADQSMCFGVICVRQTQRYDIVRAIDSTQANEFKEALRANAVAGREALTQELEAKHAEAVSSGHCSCLTGFAPSFVVVYCLASLVPQRKTSGAVSRYRRVRRTPV